MRLHCIILYILMLLSITPVRGQDEPGSDIVSRTVLSSDGTRKTVQRVYDKGLDNHSRAHPVSARADL